MKARSTINKKGFTLIEFILVIAVLGVMSTLIASFLMSAMDAWVFTKSRETALSTGRGTIERMVRELRRIKKPNNIITSASSECEFIDVDSKSVNFKQSGTRLLRNNTVLANGIVATGGLSFTYYDGSLNTTAVKNDMRYIKVRLILFKGTQTVTLEDGARIRNL